MYGQRGFFSFLELDSGIFNTWCVFPPEKVPFLLRPPPSLHLILSELVNLLPFPQLFWDSLPAVLLWAPWALSGFFERAATPSFPLSPPSRAREAFLSVLGFYIRVHSFREVMQFPPRLPSLSQFRGHPGPPTTFFFWASRPLAPCTHAF